MSREIVNQQTLSEMYLELQQLRRLLEKADTRELIDALAILEHYELSPNPMPAEFRRDR